MTTATSPDAPSFSPSSLLSLLPASLRPPLPLPIIQLVLNRITEDAARKNAHIFARMGEHSRTTYLVDPTDLAFVVTVQLNPRHPRVIAHRRHNIPPHAARIAGTLSNLMKLLDGEVDSDALFFSRTLVVEGDTAAVVVLRNSLDNMDGNFSDQIATSFGPLRPLAQWALSPLRSLES